MSNRKDYFDNLLVDFKKRAEDHDRFQEDRKDFEEHYETSEYEASKKYCNNTYNPNYEEYYDSTYGLNYKDWLSKYCVKIMESGIFHKGGLKGTTLDIYDRDFEVHTIDGLLDFVLELASNLQTFTDTKDIQGRDRWIREQFESLEKQFNRLLSTVKVYKGGRAAQIVENKRKEMLKLQEDILQRPSRAPKLQDIKRDIAIIFHKFVKSPKVVIAERVSDLLNYYGIYANPESVREKLKNK